MNNTQIAPLEEAENKSTKKIIKKKTVVKKVMKKKLSTNSKPDSTSHNENDILNSFSETQDNDRSELREDGKNDLYELDKNLSITEFNNIGDHEGDSIREDRIYNETILNEIPINDTKVENQENDTNYAEISVYPDELLDSPRFDEKIGHNRKEENPSSLEEYEQKANTLKAIEYIVEEDNNLVNNLITDPVMLNKSDIDGIKGEQNVHSLIVEEVIPIIREQYEQDINYLPEEKIAVKIDSQIDEREITDNTPTQDNEINKQIHLTLEQNIKDNSVSKESPDGDIVTIEGNKNADVHLLNPIENFVTTPMKNTNDELLEAQTPTVSQKINTQEAQESPVKLNSKLSNSNDSLNNQIVSDLMSEITHQVIIGDSSEINTENSNLKIQKEHTLDSTVSPLDETLTLTQKISTNEISPKTKTEKNQRFFSKYLPFLLFTFTGIVSTIFVYRRLKK